LPNSGGGGGGAQFNVAPDSIGGNGGSGIVLLRFKYKKTIISPINSSGFLNYTTSTGWILSKNLSQNAEATSIFSNVMSNGLIAGTQLNNSLLGKLFITTNNSAVPQIGNNTMVHHLEVDGTSRFNAKLHIVEASGTVQNANNGTIVLDHENNGGASSIVFRSKVNRGSDYAYIQYQDSSGVGGGGESARLIIGTSNDGDDHLILAPSGNVGLGTNDPIHKSTISSGQPQVLLTSGSGGGGMIIFGNGSHGVSRNSGRSYFTGGNDVALWTLGDGHCGLRTGGGGFGLLSDGTSQFECDRWHGTINDGRGRLYFAVNGPTYYKAFGTNAHIWRKEDDYTIAFLQTSGNLYANAFVSTSDERIKKI